MHVKNTIHRIVAGLCSLIVLALLGVALSAFAIAGPSVRSTAAGAPAAEVVELTFAEDQARQKTFAIDLCRQQMKRELRSPSVAVFPASSTARAAVLGRETTVRDYVDAPNAFGTPVRTEFQCVVEFSIDYSTGTVADFDAYPR